MRLLTYARTFNPRWVITLLVIVVILVNLGQARWKKHEVIVSDVSHAYAYLPALFYGHELSLRLPGDADSMTIARYGVSAAPNGSLVIKAPMGMAISYLPFFAMAHLAARAGGFETDGYSMPYQVAIQFSSLVYFVIGLIFLAKLLRLHYPGFVSSVTLLVLCFGTNAFYYLTAGGGISHPVSFMLCVLFIYQVVSWHQMRDAASASQLGLLLGALWLVRPVNILLVLVFALYDVRRWTEVKARVRLFIRKPGHLALIMVCCLLVMLPQLVYWKWTTGDLFFSQSREGDFHFTRPHVLQGLFSFRKGWLVFTPVMVLALAGFFFLRGALRMYAWAIPFFFVVYIYFVFSWWCWWYGDSFGQRALIDIYPILAIPLGAFISKLRRLGGLYKQSLLVVLALLIVLNQVMTFRAACSGTTNNSVSCEARGN
jgi:hypothetical protein